MEREQALRATATGSRTRSLTGTFGPIEIAVPRARLNTPEGENDGVEEQALRAYQRRTLAADALIAEHLSGWHQHASGAPCARRPVWRCGRQRKLVSRTWRKVEGLGRVELPLVGRRADRAAHSRRHRGAHAARPQSDLDLAPRRHRRTSWKRPKRWCSRSRAWVARAPTLGAPSSTTSSSADSSPEFLIVDGAPGLDKAIAAVWDGVPVQRCTVHKHRNLFAHAERLHDEITADYNDMIYAATSQEIEARRKAFIRKWRLKHRAVADSLEEAGDRLFTFTRLPPSQWRSAPDNNTIERLHEEFKRRIKTPTVSQSADTAAMLFWALLASGQINMRKVDGWQTLTTKLIDQPIDLAA